MTPEQKKEEILKKCLSEEFTKSFPYETQKHLDMMWVMFEERNAALKAMQVYADEEVERLKEENDRLIDTYDAIGKDYQDALNQLDTLKKQVEEKDKVLLSIRQSFYSRESCEDVWSEIDKKLAAAGFTFEHED